MLSQIRIEVIKLVRGRNFYLGFIALVGFVALMLWGFYSYADEKTGGQAVQEFKYTYESTSYFNGLTFSLYSVIFAFSLLIPIFIAMTAGSQVAGEARGGTLRTMLVRPRARVNIVLSKFVVTVGYTYSMMAFFIGLNLLIGLIFVGWGNLELFPGPLNLVDEPGKILRDEALLRFIWASFTGTWALLVIASLAFMLSVVFDNPVTAVITTLSIYLMLYIVGRIDFFQNLRPYFFTTDMDFWRDVFKPEIPWHLSLHYASRCGVYIFSFLLASTLWFDRKDITS